MSPADVFRRALAPRPKKPSVKAREGKRRGGNTETRAIYGVVAKRANGRCENCGDPFRPGNPPELDHMLGRGRARQSAENCWLIHLTCHRAKHAGMPSPSWWFARMARHARERGHGATAALLDKGFAHAVARGELDALSARVVAARAELGRVAR